MQNLLSKYKLSPSDFNDMNIVQAKTKAQTIVALHLAMENTLQSCMPPHKIAELENVIYSILAHLDKYHIDPK